MVLGLARTGRETARFLVDHGAEVVVSDCRGEKELHTEIQSLAGMPIHYLLGGEESEWVEGIETLVPSPGVPSNNPLLQEASRHGVDIISEIELAYGFLRSPLVVITGTNGKSTTTTLIGEVLKNAGIKAFVGGNIGAPLISFVSEDWDWGVVEVSSFQLEWVNQFRPRIAVLLNLSENHLDRYKNFSSYCAVKGRIFSAQGQDDIAILNRGDARVWELREQISARVVSFGWDEVDKGIFATGQEIIWRGDDLEERFPLSGVKVQGIHNVENLMAVVAVAKTIGVPARFIQIAMDAFPGIEHRHEFVSEKDGIRFYNDSKGTNVGAVFKSLASFSSPVILLAGGIDKGGDYRVLESEVKAKVKTLILFGSAKGIIHSSLGHLTDTVVVDSLEAAVREAQRHATPGDTVLLSPACSSFDMFENYEERGRVFKDLVHRL